MSASGAIIYAYAGGNPVNFTDPTGLLCLAGIDEACDIYTPGAVGPLGLGPNSCIADDGSSCPYDNPNAITPIDALPYIAGTIAAVATEGLSEIIASRYCPAFLKSLGNNPFKGKTPAQLDKLFKDKGFIPKGTDPLKGQGTYVNSKTGRGYHIDSNHLPPKGPHVGVHRPRGDLRDKLNPRDYPL